MKRTLLTVSLSLLFCFPVLADEVATPSVAEDVVVEETDEDAADPEAPASYDPDTDVTGEGAELPPDYMEQMPENIEIASEPPVAYAVNALSSLDFGSYNNVVVYHGTFNNEQYDLILPYAALSSLTVIDNRLINVGGSSVTGRLTSDGVLDPAAYDVYSYILNPVYGNTSSVYNNGNFNYRRHYYVSRSSSYDRIVYDDMYGSFYVDSYDVYYSSSERTYYSSLVIIFLIGGVILCFRKLKM